MHPSSFSLNLNLQAGPQRWKGALFNLYTPLPSAFHNDFDSLQKGATWVAGSSWDLGSPTLPCVPTVLSLVPSVPEWEWEASVPSHPLFMELRCLHIECPQTALCGWLKASRRLLRPWFFQQNAVGGLAEGTVPDWLSVNFPSQQNKAGGLWELK